jgi:hypothetical protein
MTLIRRKSTEHIEQTKFVQYVRAFHPDLICMAIPNGGDVSASQRVKLVHEGLLAGAPDLIILGKDLPTLAIEFKRPDGKGRVSDEQRGVHIQMQAVGVRIEVCKSYQEAKVVLADWLGQA